MKHISKILLALVSILSYNNTSQCMEGNTINDNSGAFSYEKEYKNLHPLLKGASVESLKVEDLKKCLWFISAYPQL